MNETAIPLAGSEVVERLLDYPSLMAAIHDAFLNPPTTPQRLAISVTEAENQPGGTVLVMPALRSAGLLGVKIITIHPGLSQRPRGAVRATYVALDAKSGELRGLIDGHALTLRRTAATSLAAARALARSDAATLLAVGTGALAMSLAKAYAEILRPERIVVWGRNRSKAEAFAQSLSLLGIAAVVAPNLREAVRSADIVTSATLSSEALVLGADVRPGTHVDLVGGFTPEMRECDDQLMSKARVVVDVESTLTETGDLRQPIDSGALRVENVQLLGEVLADARLRRISSDEITVFKSAGHALEDLAAAELLFSRWH